jgi:broad specificity phosphatase PhoE
MAVDWLPRRLHLNDNHYQMEGFVATPRGFAGGGCAWRPMSGVVRCPGPSPDAALEHHRLRSRLPPTGRAHPVTLLLVRHGQASYGAADYDNLSERGWQQSRRLGEWLVRGGHRFEAVVVGGMRRHRQTAEGVAEAFVAQGLSLPAPVDDPGFAEFDHHAVFSAYLERDPEHPIAVASRSGDPRDVGAMLQAALLAWAHDELPGVPESWEVFGARVRAEFRRRDFAPGADRAGRAGHARGRAESVAAQQRAVGVPSARRPSATRVLECAAASARGPCAVDVLLIAPPRAVSNTSSRRAP